MLKLSSMTSELNQYFICPACKSEFSHQKKIEVFDRKEDEVDGVHVKVEDNAATVDSNLTGNPSKRRQGMSIEIECEQCRKQYQLTIAQHKGQTLFKLIKLAKTEKQ